MTTHAVVLTGADATSERPDEQDGLLQAAVVSQSLARLGFSAETLHVGLDLSVLKTLTHERVGVIVNLVEALAGDGRLIHLVPAVLESLDLPFTGASADAIRVTTDKIETKARLAAAGLPTPAWSTDGSGFAAADRIIVKSRSEDASFGLDSQSVMAGDAAAAGIVAQRLRYGGEWFAEAYVDRREFNLSLLEIDGRPIVLPVAEIEFRDYPDGVPRLVDYAAKWDAASFAYANTVRQFPSAAGDGALLAGLRAQALAAWDLFALAGYARVDFRVDDDGQPFILEVNANPCLAPDAGFMAAAEEAGLGLDDVVRHLIASALTGRTVALARRGAMGGRDVVASAGQQRPQATRLVAPPSDDILDWREAVHASDIDAVRRLVTDSGFFNAGEIDVAAELVDERVRRGPASGYDFVLAEAGGGLAGYACFGPIAGAPGRYDLYWIVVDRARQGRGLGRAILRRAERLIASQGGNRVYVDTSARDLYAPTRAFYHRAGFRQVSELADFYAVGDAKVIFAKDL